MSLDFSLFILILFLHLLIFIRSHNPQKRRRLLFAVAIIGFAVPLFFIGLFLGLGGNYTFRHLAFALTASPTYIPLFSLCVYVKFLKPAQLDKHSN
ncbi:hypothetical protein [Teredinibacter turnerae]|uniref:hypothetical protein n=1 Tax=Teredinibacter turnerae TaxID=2426 RepID=UPI00036AF9FE|nr:hypothetical protein [Teredinibacter turnerae]